DIDLVQFAFIHVIYYRAHVRVARRDREGWGDFHLLWFMRGLLPAVAELVVFAISPTVDVLVAGQRAAKAFADGDGDDRFIFIQLERNFMRRGHDLLFRRIDCDLPVGVVAPA